MFSINRVTLMGFLGKDAEVKRTSRTQAAYTVFSLATNRSWKHPESGEYKSEVSWHRCIAFGKTGEAAAALLKGAHVQIEGEIRTREYTEKTTGQKAAPVKKTITEIRVHRFAKLDRPKSDASQSERPA